MRRELLLLSVLILLSVLFLSSFHYITGNFIAGQVGVSITTASQDHVCTSMNFTPQPVNQSDILEIWVSCENCGNTVLTGSTLFRVVNNESAVVFNVTVSSPSSYTLSLAEFRNSSYNWFVTEPEGFYNATGRCVFGSSFIETTKPMVIGQPLPPTTTTTTLPSGAPSGAIAGLPSYEMSIEAPEKTDGVAGEDIPIVVKVSNKKTVITGLRLVTDWQFGYVSSPSSMESLATGESAVFLLTLKTPLSAGGAYRVNVKASSKEAAAEKGIIVNITRIEDVKLRIEKLISMYDDAAKKVLGEIGYRTKEGYDTSVSQALGKRASEALSVAKTLYDAGLYEDSETKLRETRLLLVDALEELASSKKQGGKQSLPIPEIPSAVLPAAAFVATLGAIIYSVRKYVKSGLRRTRPWHIERSLLPKPPWF